MTTYLSTEKFKEIIVMTLYEVEYYDNDPVEEFKLLFQDGDEYCEINIKPKYTDHLEITVRCSDD